MSDIDVREQERRMRWLLEEHDRMKELIVELQKARTESETESESGSGSDPVEEETEKPRPQCPYLPAAIVAVLLSYMYGIVLGVYVCPK